MIKKFKGSIMLLMTSLIWGTAFVAQCGHVNHVSTQLSYALTVAAVCVVGYIFSGFVQYVFAILGLSIVLMLAVLLFIRSFEKKKSS